MNTADWTDAFLKKEKKKYCNNLRLNSYKDEGLTRDKVKIDDEKLW